MLTTRRNLIWCAVAIIAVAAVGVRLQTGVHAQAKPAAASACKLNEALISSWVEAQNKWAAGTSFVKPATTGTAEVRGSMQPIMDNARQLTPENIAFLLTEEEKYYQANKNRTDPVTRMSILRMEIKRDLVRCIAAEQRGEPIPKPAPADAPAGGAGTTPGQGSTGNENSCQPALARQEKDFDAINKRRPANVDVVPELQVVLYMTSERLALLDRVCKNDAAYATYADMKKSHDGAMQACMAIAASPATCVPRVAW